MNQINVDDFYKNEFFHFNQKNYRTFESKKNGPQGPQGMCFGISLCLLSFLVNRQGTTMLCPERSYHLTEMYMRRLQLSYLSLESVYFNSLESNHSKSLESSNSSQRLPGKKTEIDELYKRFLEIQDARFQNDYMCYTKNVDIEESINYGMLTMVRINGSLNTPPCKHYQQYFPSANHMGVIAWNNRKLFIFDPNCGGLLYNAACEDFNKEMLPQLIDRLIDYMYTKAGNIGHCRIQNVIQPIKHDNYLKYKEYYI
ncbi:hypothetical protein [Xenorhabdus taiwanensis]|uniref:Peptidase C58 YopT-type domain-containing protein n=1 Tax=Xenorhabdus taiwanensis TaxID=3085177 RepID=A0ABN7C5B0_9GAMM|nr:hypothetical protein TCT1_24830 [Xenorhabdus sp. TCT-1]